MKADIDLLLMALAGTIGCIAGIVMLLFAWPS